MSRLITYTKSFPQSATALTGNGTISFQQPIQFRRNTKRFIKIINGSIPSSIINISSKYNNNTIKINLAHAPDPEFDFVVSLVDGTYSVDALAASINYSIQDATSLITSLNDPPITFGINETLQRVYITIDSTKLTNPDYVITLDLTNEGTSIFNDVVGYVATDAILGGDGTYESDYVARIDWIGNICDVKLGSLGNLSLENGRSSTTLVSINLATSSASNQYNLPSAGEVFPYVPIQCDDLLYEIPVTFTGSDGTPVYFLTGQIKLMFNIIETNEDYLI